MIVHTLIVVLFLHQYAPSQCLEYTPPSEIKNSASSFNYTKIEGLGGIEFSYEPYQTWGQTIKVPDLLLVAHPRSSDEIVSIVNWARTSGRKVRPRGYTHSFPPLTVTKDTNPNQVVLLDLTKYMTKLSMTTVPAEQTVKNESLTAVTAEAGASWQDLLTFCEKHNAGILHSIIIGDASVGGVLAIGAHGAVVPAKGETVPGGFSYGSISNLIASFKAVVFDKTRNEYILKSFIRSDPDARAFLVHVGRALITEATLLVGPNYNLRCQSFTDIPTDELFANPNKADNSTRTLVSILDDTGRADIQWYQFTKKPWVKVWIIEPEKPDSSVEVKGPYNYQFPVNVKDSSKTVPELGEIAYNNVVKGLQDTNATDIWGPSKNILLYSNGSSQSVLYSGFVILTTRDRIQSTLNTLSEEFTNLNEEYAKKSEYPIEYYIKFRVTKVDNASETLLKGAGNTALSPLSVPQAYPHYDTALWMNTFTSPDNPLGSQFMRRFEAFAFGTFDGENGLARSEWSKSWGFADEGPFLNITMIKDIIPKTYGADWKWASSVFNKYDPERLFSNEFLDNLLP